MVNPSITKRDAPPSKRALWLLPWLPAAAVYALIRYRRPATDWVLVEKMRIDAPSIYYSKAQQLEQAYPGIHVFAALAVLAALAFAVGLGILLRSYFRSRRTTDAAPTI
jgi:hypothetical protein